MKKRILLYLSILIIIIASIWFFACNKKYSSDEELINGFAENFFTNDSTDYDLYKDYFTDDAFKYFKTDLCLQGRAPKSMNDKFNTEIKNFTTTNITKENSEVHSYTTTFTLIDKDTEKEKEVILNFYLSKENGAWKLNENNKIETSMKHIFLLFEKDN